ncbi:MAG: dihydroorotate dehydrogenase electron transfer subunit [Gammaproteobacteria bacterium]|nr:dihydroorotate dehydrogenase electron transfer subunit [Gammaproteobacteria bacterium]MDH5650379.1 dihydroorotate dehydrogenase electron transfer subunit [Gammaproteobacteria bacterium]
MNKPHRDTICVEEAEIISHDAWPGNQYILRILAEGIAADAKPGSFVHLTVDPQRPMRRPISIMRANPKTGMVDLLYKVVGEGTTLLSHRKPGERINVMGPIGNGFTVDQTRSLPLLIGGGVGMPPMIFLAEHYTELAGYHPFVILGSEVPFPFQAEPSKLIIPGMPDGVIAGVPLLEEWGIPSRLTSLQGYPGCHEGYVTDLARQWLDAMDESDRKQVIIYSCGPHPMLEAVAKLAKAYNLPCQVSLEEFMACAVGGCAGCVVKVETDTGPAMKRVCVDGPVFEAATVF